MTPPDARPILVCRDHIPEHMIDEVDGWIPKHFDDSLAYPAVTAAASYAVAWGLPAVFADPGCRIIVYIAEDMPGMLAWLDSPELRAAIDDGTEREAQVIPVDGDPFTGNIYEAVDVRQEIGTEFPPDGRIYIERYEVDDRAAPEFDEWLNGPRLDALARWPGAIRARTWVQNRDVPDRFPYDRYVSKGNRMLSVDFSADADVGALLADERAWAGIADSAQWERRLPYVRREAGTQLVVRYPAAS